MSSVGRRLGRHQDHRRQDLERALLLRERMQRDRAVSGFRRHAQQLRHEGQCARRVAAVFDQAGADALELQPRVALLGQPQPRAQHLGDGIERAARVVRRAETVELVMQFRREAVAEHLHHAGLADAGLPREHDHAAAAGGRIAPRAVERRHDRLTTDVGGESRRPEGVHASVRAAGRLHHERLHGLGEAFDRLRAQALHPEELRHQPSRRAADDDGVGLGEPLHARGDVRRVAHREALRAVRTADVTHDRQAGVDADAHGERHRPLRAQPRVQLGDGVDDVETGLHGASSIIFMRDGIAEVDQDAVAVELRDGALVAADGRRRGFAVVADDVAEILRVDFARQLRGSHQVAEDERHVAAFDGRRDGGRGARGGRVGRPRRRRARRAGACEPRQRRAALGAEARPRRVLRAARRAARRERGAALRAESGARNALCSAAGTTQAHDRGSGSRGRSRARTRGQA